MEAKKRAKLAADEIRYARLCKLKERGVSLSSEDYKFWFIKSCENPSKCPREIKDKIYSYLLPIIGK